MASTTLSPVRPSVPTQFPPTATASTSGSSLPSPNDLFAYLSNHPMPVASSPVRQPSIKPFKGVYEIPDSEDEAEAVILVPSSPQVSAPVPAKAKPAARKKPAATKKSTAGTGAKDPAEKLKIKAKAKPPKSRKKPATEDDDAGNTSKYFKKAKQTKPAAVKGARGGKKVADVKDVAEEVLPKALAPPPRKKWTPVKNSVQTIDLSTSSPEEEAGDTGVSFAEKLKMLRCNRNIPEKLATSGAKDVDGNSKAIGGGGGTRKRDVQLVELPNLPAPKPPAKRTRKKKTDADQTTLDGSLLKNLNKKPPTKKKQKPNQSTLLSPLAAQKLLEEQTFIFATASQLENSSPIEATTDSSRPRNSPPNEHPTNAGKRLRRVRPTSYTMVQGNTGLWVEGRDIDNEPDLCGFEKLQRDNDLIPFEMPSADNSPSAGGWKCGFEMASLSMDAPLSPSPRNLTPEFSIQIPRSPSLPADANSIPPSPSPIPIPPSSHPPPPPSSPTPTHVTSSLPSSPSPSSPILAPAMESIHPLPPPSISPKRPNFLTFTTSQLREQMEICGLKNVVARVTMIKHLNQWWEKELEEGRGEELELMKWRNELCF